MSGSIGKKSVPGKSANSSLDATDCVHMWVYWEDFTCTRFSVLVCTDNAACVHVCGINPFCQGSRWGWGLHPVLQFKHTRPHLPLLSACSSRSSILLLLPPSRIKPPRSTPTSEKAEKIHSHSYHLLNSKRCCLMKYKKCLTQMCWAVVWFLSVPPLFHLHPFSLSLCVWWSCL